MRAVGRLTTLLVVSNVCLFVQGCTKQADGNGGWEPNPNFSVDGAASVGGGYYKNYIKTPDLDDIDFMWRFQHAPQLKPVRPAKPTFLDDDEAKRVFNGFSCGNMLRTYWKVGKVHLYQSGEMPASNFYYIGKWLKHDADGNELTVKDVDPNGPYAENGDGRIVTRNPAKNCWRRFKNVPIIFDSSFRADGEGHNTDDEGYFSLCKWGDYVKAHEDDLDPGEHARAFWDDDEERCIPSKIKNTTSSASSFKYQTGTPLDNPWLAQWRYEQESDPLGALTSFFTMLGIPLPFFLADLVSYRATTTEQFGKLGCTLGNPSGHANYCGSLREIYDKRMKYQERMNCKMKITQDSFGISTTIEIRGKEKAPANPNRGTLFDYKPRSLFFHCFYPTVDTTLDAQYQIPKGFLTSDKSVLPDAEKYARLYTQDGSFKGYVRDPDDVCGDADFTCEENNNMHFYGFGHLEAQFSMSLAGGTVKSKMPQALIGDTVLVRVVPTSPEFYLGPETASQAAMNAGYYPQEKCDRDNAGCKDHPRDNRHHLRWLLNRCVLRNTGPDQLDADGNNAAGRPKLNSAEEDALAPNAAGGLSITRKPENHPFHNYVEVDLVNQNCFGETFYAQAFTKFAIQKEDPNGATFTHNPDGAILASQAESTQTETLPHGLVMGYEVFSLASEFRRQCTLNRTSWEREDCVKEDNIYLTLDCDVKICMKDTLTGDLLWPDCYKQCTDPGEKEFEVLEDEVGGNMVRYPTTSTELVWSTSSIVTDAGKKLTEEPKTYNYAFKVYEIGTDADGNDYKVGSGVWHTHPFLRVFENLRHPHAAQAGWPIGEGDLNTLGVPEGQQRWEIDIDNDYTHDDWDGDDEDLDADMADPHKPADDDHDKNSPKFFGTVEPITYTTVTPWENWKEGMAALRNCTDWREHRISKDTDGSWQEFDEKRCDAIELFMATGPNGDQAGDNAEAAEEMGKMQPDDKNLCTEDMIDMEDESCQNQIGSPNDESLEVGCCLSNCNECTGDCKCCTCNQQCNGVLQCPSPACFSSRNVQATNSCPCQCGKPCPSGYNPYCDQTANPGPSNVCDGSSAWCPTSCRMRRFVQEADDATAASDYVDCSPCCVKDVCENQDKSCDMSACDGTCI